MQDLKHMQITEYIWHYTNRKEMRWGGVWMEFMELVEAIRLLDWENIKEEVGDTLLFFQIWLFWQFSLDFKVWRITHHSARKFMARQPVWIELYITAGLNPKLDPSTANYKRLHKVVQRLTMFGVDKTKAKEAYNKVVLPRLETQL